jgi:hypothetical protein
MTADEAELLISLVVARWDTAAAAKRSIRQSAESTFAFCKKRRADRALWLTTLMQPFKDGAVGRETPAKWESW